MTNQFPLTRERRLLWPRFNGDGNGSDCKPVNRDGHSVMQAMKEVLSEAEKPFLTKRRAKNGTKFISLLLIGFSQTPQHITAFY